MNGRKKNILIIAGEASGDQHASELIKAVLAQRNDVCFFAMGGKKMKEAGAQMLVDATPLAVVGFAEVFRVLPALLSAWQTLKRALTHHAIDLVILVDYPGFNLRFAKLSKQIGIKVLYYISPQIWAWKAGRIKKIKQYVDHMAVIFPFEAPIYQRAHIPVSYVENPILHHLRTTLSHSEALTQFSLDESKKTICLMPGSRTQEITRLLPVFCDAAQLIASAYPNVQFILPLASSLKKEQLTPYLKKIDVPIQLITDHTYDAINVSDVVIAASGTATLEIALLGKPLIIAYQLSWLTYSLVRHLIKLKHVGLCNIVAEQTIAPELIQRQATPEHIADYALPLLRDDALYAERCNTVKIVHKKLADHPEKISVASLVEMLI